MEYAQSKNSKGVPNWNHQPEVPIRLSSMFDWPPRPIEIIKYLARLWLATIIMIVNVAFAVTIYFWLLPDFSVMKEFSPGWLSQLWLRNAILLTIVAGGLHLYFYTFRAQGKNLKFEHKQQNRNSKFFTFSDQVYDNMFWSIVSGVTIWSAYEALYFWARANEYVPTLGFAENPVWFVALFIFIPVWSSMHFYWIHRFLHWPPLYKLAHSLHHRNVNIGPWSGISMHPIEHVLYFSTFAIHFVVASHPLHVLFHCYYQALQPATSHCGFEGLQRSGKKPMKLGDFFHQLHHKHFSCNYGTIQMPWDRWFGSFHDGTQESYERMMSKKRRRPLKATAT